MRGALPSITATAELVVPRSIPMIGPFTFPLSAFVSSAYPRRNCVIGARRADDRKVDVARGTACVRCQSRLNARVMANVAEELPLTFRITLEESIFAGFTHYDTRKEEGTMEMDERAEWEVVADGAK